MIANAIALCIGWLLDRRFGDPAWLPHPVVAFGKAIAWGDHLLNRGSCKWLKGGCMAVAFVLLTYFVTFLILDVLAGLSLRLACPSLLETAFSAILIFYGLAGTTLVKETRAVFLALDKSLEEGRRQVARIVGRDTAHLSAQEVKQAALETLAENLSDGVVAPLFWLALLGVPGMMAYKMVNTLDSMIGYRTSRYWEFGCVAARIDDLANLLPARLTALLMLLVTPPWKSKRFVAVLRDAHKHLSPNSGWPEAALAAILDCQFGGTHEYFGEKVEKPHIGRNPRILCSEDVRFAIVVNQRVEIFVVLSLLFMEICMAIK